MDFDFSPITESWAFLLYGLRTTLLLSLFCVGTSLVLGTIAAIARVYGPKAMSLVIAFYVDTMRSLPLLVVMVWIYFALPIITGVNLPPFWSAALAITVHVTATVTEIVRAGLESIRPGQKRAGLALGMSSSQVIRKVILPQAAIRMLPAVGSVVSTTIKDTAIATVIAVPELMKQSETVASQSYRPLEVYTFAMLIYFLILLPTTRGIDRIYRRYAHLGRS